MIIVYLIGELKKFISDIETASGILLETFAEQIGRWTNLEVCCCITWWGDQNKSHWCIFITEAPFLYAIQNLGILLYRLFYLNEMQSASL